MLDYLGRRDGLAVRALTQPARPSISTFRLGTRTPTRRTFSRPMSAPCPSPRHSSWPGWACWAWASSPGRRGIVWPKTLFDRKYLKPRPALWSGGFFSFAAPLLPRLCHQVIPLTGLGENHRIAALLPECRGLIPLTGPPWSPGKSDTLGRTRGCQLRTFWPCWKRQQRNEISRWVLWSGAISQSRRIALQH